MSPHKRYAKKQATARARRRHSAQKRLARAQRPAQRAAEALHQTLEELGLPAALGVESAGRLPSQQKRLGQIVGVMFPALCGCHTPSELCRVRGGDKHWPSRLLGALPTRAWLKRLRRLGLEVFAPIWRHVPDTRPATQRRGQWTWVGDDAVCHKDGTQLALVGRWWSGQHTRGVSGLDGRWLLGGMGAGRLIVPVDCAIRRPDPVGPGAPCRDKLTWARVRLEERWAALRRRGVALPAPLVVAERWFGDSQLMQHGREAPQGTVLVEGKASYGFPWADGRPVKGHDLIEGKGGRWHQPPWEQGGHDVRLRATSPPYGQGPGGIVDEPGPDRFSLLSLETERSAPQLSRRGRRRSGMACVLRTLKHLVATEACPVPTEDASSGPLVLRLMGSFILFYTARVICQVVYDLFREFS